MSLIEEIHNQRPLVRHTFFYLAAGMVISAVVVITVSSMRKDIFFAMHPDTEERQAYLQQRDENLPKPVAALARLAGSLTANIGSLIGWNRDAGFDRGGQQDTMQGGVHLLPLSD